jgi:hypothetical protein
MEHRHLLPNEIDLLVDGDLSAGFGVSPLRAHLDECADCRARVDELRAVADLLDSLPHHAPRLRFADEVMAQVQVVEPWHVALTDSARKLVPEGKAGRALVAAGAGVAAVTVSGSAVWLAFRADLATWAFNLFLDRGRESVIGGAGELAARALGPDAVATLSQGGVSAFAIPTALLLVSAVAAAAGFRRLASTARAKRS